MLTELLKMFRKTISRPGWDTREAQNYKLRVYLDQIKTVESMSSQAWLDQWITSGMPWMPKDMHLAYLKECALEQARLCQVAAQMCNCYLYKCTATSCSCSCHNHWKDSIPLSSEELYKLLDIPFNIIYIDFKGKKRIA